MPPVLGFTRGSYPLRHSANTTGSLSYNALIFYNNFLGHGHGSISMVHETLVTAHHYHH